MLRNFCASPNFLGLLRFWDSSRRGAAAPDWDGEISRIPSDLLPRLIIVERTTGERAKGLVYRYVGAESRRQFQLDPTGRTIAATLSPEYAAYLADITDSTLDRAAPIFSASVLHRQDKMKLTGRLVVPFILRGASRPNLVMSAHLAGGDDFKVTEVVEPGGVVETQRLMIAGVPDVCARLEQAARYHRLAGVTTDRYLASEWDEIARDLGAGALVPLHAYHEARR